MFVVSLALLLLCFSNILCTKEVFMWLVIAHVYGGNMHREREKRAAREGGTAVQSASSREVIVFIKCVSQFGEEEDEAYARVMRCVQAGNEFNFF